MLANPVPMKNASVHHADGSELPQRLEYIKPGKSWDKLNPTYTSINWLDFWTINDVSFLGWRFLVSNRPKPSKTPATCGDPKSWPSGTSATANAWNWFTPIGLTFSCLEKRSFHIPKTSKYIHPNTWCQGIWALPDHTSNIPKCQKSVGIWMSRT